MIPEKTKKYTAIFNGYSSSFTIPPTEIAKALENNLIYEDLKKVITADFKEITNEQGVLMADFKGISLMEEGVVGMIGFFRIGKEVTFTATVQLNVDSTYGFDFIDVIFDQQKRPRG